MRFMFVCIIDGNNPELYYNINLLGTLIKVDHSCVIVKLLQLLANRKLL